MKKNQKDELTAMYIRIPTELHAEIKKRAIDKRITLNKWVLRAINKKKEEERSYE